MASRRRRARPESAEEQRPLGLLHGFALCSPCPSHRGGKTVRAHHMSHHFADVDSNFGIGNRRVERLLGTVKTPNTAEQKQDHNGSDTPAPKA